MQKTKFWDINFFLLKDLKRENIFIVFLFLLILPFLILSFFIHPSADDFIYSSWAEVPHNQTYWQYQYWNYMSWNGRYFSTILLTLNPLVYGSFLGYKCIPLFILIIFYSGLFSLLKVIFEKSKNVNIITFTSLLSLIYFNSLPSLPDSLYWMSGAITYTLTLSFIFFYFSLFIKKHNFPQSLFIKIMLLILSFFIAGSNELSAFLITLIMLIILVNKYFIEKIKDSFLLINVFFLVFLCVFVIIAPGNKVRLMLFENHYNLSYAIESTFINTLKIAIYYFKNPTVLIFLFMTFLNSVKLNSQSSVLKKMMGIKFWLIPSITFFLILFFYFISAFNMGIEPPMRVHGFIGFILITGSIFFFLQLGHKYVWLEMTETVLKKIKFCCAILLIIFVLTGFHRKPGQDFYFTSNVTMAIYDLKSGAIEYNREMFNRYSLINKAKDNNIRSIKVPHLSIIPESIFFTDIKRDSSHWINWGTAKYFDIESISIE